jgi:RNA polymerase sigma-70 factor (ECF subfamily)
MGPQPATSIDEHAVLAIFDRALPEVYDYLLHRCRERSVAEDLTSETFLAAVAEIRRNRCDDISVAWLIGIARHKLADHWRRRARDDRKLAAIADEPMSALTETPIEPGRAMSVLAMINPMQRAALTLRHIDGLSVPQVADVLGRSVHATETLLVRARAAFRRRYDECKDTDDE